MNGSYVPKLGKAPTVPCCDICNHKILNATRLAAPPPNSRKTVVSYKAVNPATKSSLNGWCSRIWNRDFGRNLQCCRTLEQ